VIIEEDYTARAHKAKALAIILGLYGVNSGRKTLKAFVTIKQSPFY
jgi:hypothetical protein